MRLLLNNLGLIKMSLRIFRSGLIFKRMAPGFCSVFLRSLCSKGRFPIFNNVIRRIGSSSCRLDKNEGSEGEAKNKESEKLSLDKSKQVGASMEEKSQDELWMKGRSEEVVMTHEFSGFADRDVTQTFVEKPLPRILRILKYDRVRMKERWMSRLGMDFKSELENYYYGPTHADVVIIGGGAIGSSCAYWIKEKVNEGLRVVVIERDPTYRTASSSLSVGGLRQQFSLPESIQMSLFGAEFMRSIGTTLKVEGLPTPNVCFEPYGYLLLASEEGAETLTENSKLQNSLGARNVLLNSRRLRERFPWLNTDGIVLGCLGIEKEGWFDPWGLMLSFKTKAMSLGAEYVKGEVVGFQFQFPHGKHINNEYFKKLHAVVVKRPDGLYTTVEFAKCVIAAGPDSGVIGKLAGFGMGCGIFKVPLPVERRKRYVFCFHCPDGPGLDTPLTVDPSGVYFRREGLCNKYICGLSPPEDEEPRTDNLDVDYEYFDEKVWPLLAKRIPRFENLKIKNGWAGFYEHNPVDMNGIIGPHPAYGNLYFACGFSGHGIQHSPAVGRAISELIVSDDFTTIDLTRLGFSRFANREILLEKNIV